jgi:lipid II isoglutaminyl synthase (glutamine-hydrolysing)
LAGVVDHGIAAVGRAAGALSRFTRLGSGTSVPGRLVNALDPGFLARRAARLDRGVIVVSGTNGKTTTASMLGCVLLAEGLAVASNASGANLPGGVVSALLGKPQEPSVGVLEVDEAVLPSVVTEVRPRLLLLTNVFRDQLDRFPEPEGVAAQLRMAAERLPSGSVLVANADDPLLWASLEDLGPVGFSVVAPPDVGVTVRGGGVAGASEVAADAEPESCPRCGAGLVFDRRTIAASDLPAAKGAGGGPGRAGTWRRWCRGRASRRRSSNFARSC